MTRHNQYHNVLSRAVRVIGMLVVTMAASHAARVQTFTVLHTFTGGADGANPFAGLTMDRAGNLYGTAAGGGISGNNTCLPDPYGGISCGTVFKLSHHSSSWIFETLYAFSGQPNGANPEARVIIGPDGDLYGTTNLGGTGFCAPWGGCGTVFKLSPPPNFCASFSCPWRETVLNSFAQDDGAYPQSADLVFDQQGNRYGTTPLGGSGYYLGPCGTGLVGGCGVIFELSPSGGGWTEDVLLNFDTVGGGGPISYAYPYSGVTLDNAGNLYGTASAGGTGWGVVYKATLSGTSSILYSFPGGSDGAGPYGGLISDGAGGLYGTTYGAGTNGGGTAFDLTPSNDGWTLNTLYSFSGGGGPLDTPLMDGAGNLYGTTYGDGAYGYGSIFKLSPSDGGWSYTSLHDFTGGSDGAYPYGGVVLDANGNLYSTTSEGGSSGNGVVFEIAP